MIENLIKKKKGETAMVTLTKKRIKNNLNLICMFTGRTGAGKTWSAISFAEQLNPNFDPEKHIVFDFKECMDAIDLINKNSMKNKNLKVLLWDEVQISLSNRAWQSQMNRLVNYLVSSFRHQNIILILTAPYKDFLDSQTMKLLHWEFQCSSIDRKRKKCIVFPKYQQYNPQKKKTYPHSLYVIVDGKQKMARTWAIMKPSKKSIDIYERRKTEFTTKLNQSIRDTLTQMEDKEKNNVEGEVKDKKPLTELQEEILELHNKGLNQKQIREKLGKHQAQISINVKYMRNKGFSI